MSKKQYGFIGFFLVFVSFLFAQNMLVDRYLSAATSCLENKEYEIILVGNEEIIKSKLTEYGFSGDNITIKNATHALLAGNMDILTEHITKTFDFYS